MRLVGSTFMRVLNYRHLLVVVFCLALVGPWTGDDGALAVEPGEILKDAKLEKRARIISAQLRCLVCQNQSIDDSNAPLAHDLRVLVRERISAGDNDGEVFSYVVARYGDYVLLKPPFNAYTLLLWLTPFLVLFGASFLLYRNYHNRRAMTDAGGVAKLSDEEQAALDDLLTSHDDERSD